MKIHFIGIGGIGVSSLAQYYLKTGHKVSGSDLVCSEVTDLLKEKGADVVIGLHNEKNISNDIDLIIYSPAVKPDNPEFKKAEELDIKTQSYPQALGDLTKKYFTIAVSGTHGKSTTTAMISLILIEADLDPTVIIGTKLKEFNNTNFRLGQGKYLIIEADEWQASFLNYWPKIIVLTNIEVEHMDFYKNLGHILETYKEYIGHLPEDGILAMNEDDENIKKIFNFPGREADSPKGCFPIFNKFSIKQFSNKQKEAEILRKILKVPGKHNIYNGLAALAVARVLKIKKEIAYKALSKYKGAWRRFEEKELKIGNCKLKIISDYGHHPTEVEATLKAAREKFPDKKIWCLFQPHQYQRTYYLFNDFVKVFSDSSIDNIIITDIYDVAGREEGEISNKVSSKKLVKAINRSNVYYYPKEEAKNYLKANLKQGEVLIIMGAGDIYKLVDEFSEFST